MTLGYFLRFPYFPNDIVAEVVEVAEAAKVARVAEVADFAEVAKDVWARLQQSSKYSCLPFNKQIPHACL